LPLFQNPSELFPEYRQNFFSPHSNQFPHAQSFFQRAIKLPVWAQNKNKSIVDAYIRGIVKVSRYYQYLL